MKIRAVIFDIYKTILDVAPAPSNAAVQWEILWKSHLNTSPRMDLGAFGQACEKVIARLHEQARAQGIAYPEVFWPEVVSEVLPEFASLTEIQQAEFLYRQVQLWHTVQLMPGAAEVLRGLMGRKLPLGIASNAQAYTLRELDESLASAGLGMDSFSESLCFFSFQHGFSKPDPHVFRLLSFRLANMSIAPGETLMVGDRLDNDLDPSSAQGWQTWRLDPANDDGTGGSWAALWDWLQPRL